MRTLIPIIVVFGLLVMAAVSYERQKPVVTVPDSATTATQPTKNTTENVPGVAQVVIYDGITIPKSATTLNLSGRGLTGSLKAEVRQLSALRELNLSGNNFTGLPAEVGQLSQLEILNLANNPLTGLPYELGNLHNLKILDLRGTNYSQADLDVIRQSLPSTTDILVD